MHIEPVTLAEFEEWQHSPVTKRLMKRLASDREVMKEGLVNGSFDNEEEVKGRCRAIAVLLALEYEDLFEQVTERLQ
jgi:aminoglycoside phosphotransferase